MADSAPKHEGRREPISQPDPTSAPTPTGLTRFLVDAPESAGISRETLIEAVRSLIRERDHLRRTRDILVADFQQETRTLNEHADELEERLLAESEAAREQAEELQREVAGLRGEVQKLTRERDEIRADRDAVAADRAMWRSLVKNRGARGLRRKLARWLGSGQASDPGIVDDGSADDGPPSESARPPGPGEER